MSKETTSYSLFQTLNSLDLSLTLVNDEFHAGQVVCGEVILSSTVSILIHQLDVNIEGISQSHPKIEDRESRCSMVVPRITTRCYITGKQSLVSGGKLNPGVYKFGFQVSLPEACPSSMKRLQYGNVEYKCIVELQSDQHQSTAHQSFKVTGQPRYFFFATPSSRTVELGKNTLVASLDKGGYLPGDTIECSVNGPNGKVDADKIKFEIRQKLTFSWIEMHIYKSEMLDNKWNVRQSHDLMDKTIETVLAEEQLKLNTGHQGLQVKTKIKLPSDCIPSFEGKHTRKSVYPVTIEYWLRMKIRSRGLFSKSIDVCLPFLLGHNIMAEQGKQRGATQEFCLPPSEQTMKKLEKKIVHDVLGLD